MNRTHGFLVLLSVLALCMTACAPSLVIETSGNNVADISFKSVLSPFGESLSRRLSGNTDTTVPLYERSAVVSSLGEAGLVVHSLSFPEGTGIDFSGSVSDFTTFAGALLSSSPSRKAITLTLSPDTLQEVLGMIPPETRDLAELLMAPVFTGEDLQTDEYLDILSAAYGERASEEIAASRCTLRIKAPQPVQEVHCSGTYRERITTGYSGCTVTAAIPLDLLLTLSETITLTVEW